MVKRLDHLDYSLLHEAVARFSSATDHGLREAVVEHFRLNTEGQRPRADGTFIGWWDLWAEQARAGRSITVTPSRCLNCNGKGFSHRTMARDFGRTGSYACGDCRGTRRGKPTQVRLQPLPEEVTRPLRERLERSSTSG